MNKIFCNNLIGTITQNRYIVEPEKVKKNKFEEYVP